MPTELAAVSPAAPVGDSPPPAAHNQVLVEAPRTPELEEEMAIFVRQTSGTTYDEVAAGGVSGGQLQLPPALPPSAAAAAAGPVQGGADGSGATAAVPAAKKPKRAYRKRAAPAAAPALADRAGSGGGYVLQNTAQEIRGALAGFDGFVGLSDKKKGKPLDDAETPYLGRHGTREQQVAEALRWMAWSNLRAGSASRLADGQFLCKNEAILQ